MRSLLAAGLLLICSAPLLRAQDLSPQLDVDASRASPEAAARFRQVDTSHLGAIARLLGLTAAGEPVSVILAGEDSDVARDTPPWIAGFAIGGRNTVVIFPARAARYPDDSLEALLNHEIAHVLIHRAAGGNPLPRWFNEGLATTVERTWRFEDARHLAWAVASGRELDLAGIDAEFGRGEGPAARAYAVSGAFVRSVIDRHGPRAPGAILARVAGGERFEAAYESVTGEALEDAEALFRRDVVSWDRILPILTSPFVLWTGISLLALYAIVVSRRRRRERRDAWPEEDSQEGARSDPTPDAAAEDVSDPGRGT